MSKTVDERVVSMQFDNKDFEKNVSTTMESLDKLEDSLQLKGASKGIETVKSKFSGLQVMAVTALANITNSAVNAGKRIVSSLTIDPIKTGLAEYETQLNSVQTILANTESKGSTLDDVNKALDELNAYADKTIYNFTEMTRNIGTFTAAGVELDTSVSAIKGIANLAAVSGSTSQQASTAMYQLSQALASGTVKLMDWNSVVNAGMGGQIFQDALKETARVHGVAIDDIIKKQGSFRESLSEGWLTSEILTETLSKFTGDLNEEQLKSMGYTEEQIKGIIKLGESANDAATKVKTFTQLLDTLKEAAQSGWAQTWELVFGDFEEAKAFWTKVSDEIGGLIGDSADKRNKLLTGTLNSGWDNFLGEGIANESGLNNWIKTVSKGHNVAIDEMVEKYGSLDKAIQSGIKDGTITHEILAEALGHLTEETNKLSVEQLNSLGLTKDQVTALDEFNKKIQNGEVSIEEYYSKMQKLSGRELLFNIEYDENGLIKYNENTGALVNIYGALLSLINPIKEAFREVFPATTSDQLYGILEAFRRFTESLILSSEQSEKLKTTFKGLFAVLDIIWKVIKDVASAIYEMLGHISEAGGSFLDLTSTIGDLLMKFRDFVKEQSIVSRVLNGLVSIVQRAVKLLDQFFTAINDYIQTSGFQTFANVLKAAWNAIHAIIKGISKALSSIFGGIDKNDLTFLMDTMSSGVFLVAVLKLKDAFTSIGKAGSGIIDALKEMGSNFSGILTDVRESLKSFQQQIKSKIIMNIAIALGILAASVALLSMLNPEKISNALGALVLMFTGLMASLSVFNKMTNDGGFKNMRATTAMIGIASSVLILSASLAIVSSLSWSEVLSGLTAMGGAMGLLLGALKTLEYIKVDKKVVKQIKKLSNMMITLSIALKIMATMSWGDIARSLTAMAGALSILVGTVALLSLVSKISDDNTAVKKINKLARMLIVLGVALKIMATMSWEDIGQALTAMAGALSVLVGAVALTALVSKIGDNKAVNKLLLMTTSLIILGLALKIMGSMSWSDVGQSLTALTGALIALVATIAVLSKIQNGGKALLNVITLIAMAKAVTILAVALTIMGNMDWAGVGKSLVAMTGALALLVGAIAIMSKMSSGGKSLAGAATILILVGAINLLVPALTLLGSLSVGTIAKGLITMALSLAIFGAAAALLSKYTGAILSFGAAIALFGVGIGVIAAGIGALAAGLSVLITAIVAGGAALVATIVSLVKSLIELLPFLLTKIGEALVAFCKVITDGAPAIGEAIVAVVLMVIDLLVRVIPQLVDGLFKIIMGVLESLVQYVPQIVGAIFQLLIGILKSIGDYIPDFIQAAVDLMMRFFEGFIEALKSIDKDTLVNGIYAVGLISALMLALANISALVPPAMLGCVGAGLVIAELAFVLAAIGALARIPGLSEIVADSGSLLAAVGTAIGQFVGGIIGGITAEASKSLPVLGTNLAEFMTNMTPFLDGLRSIDAGMMACAAILTGIIILLTANNLIDGITRFLTLGTTKSLGDFGKEVGVFGHGIKDFANATKGIDAASVKDAAQAGKYLAEMAKNVPVSGGLWQLIAGKKDLKGFANQLGGFGKGVKEFAEQVKGVNGTSVKRVSEAGIVIAEMAKKIPTSGGLWDLIAGENDIEGFANQLGGLGKGISAFQKATEGVSLEAVQNGVDAAKIIIEMTKKITKTGGLWQLIVGELDMSSLATQLGHFGNAIVTFVNTVNSIGDVNATVDTVNALNKCLNDFSVDGIGAFVDSFVEARPNLANVVSEMINAAVDAIGNKADKFKKTAEKYMKKFINAVKSYKANVRKTFVDIVESALDAIDTKIYYEKFYNVGKFLVSGLSAGIERHMSWVEEAARKLARNASDGAKEELDEHSPSKVGYEIGDFFGVAFVNAISDYENKAYNASSDMASSAKSGLSEALAAVSDMIESDIDAQPTIRPVLDLSGVAAGANSISGMFGMSPSVGVMANVSSINSSMNKKQVDANSEVISAINGLKDTMQNASGDTYNINGVTYSEGSEIQSAIETIVRAIIRERRS